MNLPPFEWFMLGAGAGWILCAIGFLIFDAWRSAPFLALMSDDKLVRHAAAVKREVIYRFPSEARAEDEHA